MFNTPIPRRASRDLFPHRQRKFKFISTRIENFFYLCIMISIILIIILYITILYSVIRAAVIGKGLFFPDFKRIDEYYQRKGGISVPTWNTWYGKLGYYFELFVFLVTIAFLLILLLAFVFGFLSVVKNFLPSF